MRNLGETIMSLKALKQVVNNGNYVILDTETTGLYDAEIIEIAIIDPDGKPLMDKRVKPINGIPADATAIHGITMDDVQDCDGFDIVLLESYQILNGKDVIVYNANYDYMMFKNSAKHARIFPTDWNDFGVWHCAMKAFAPVYGDWNNYRKDYKWKPLATAAQYYNIKVENAHSALGDCLMTLGVVKAMTSNEIE